jgi:hypothetical protein
LANHSIAILTMQQLEPDHFIDQSSALLPANNMNSHPGNEVNLERLEDKLQRSLHDPRITGIGDLAKQSTIP